MYIVAPYDCKDLLGEESTNNVAETISESNLVNFTSWRPTYTQALPERVTLFRTAALAKRSYNFLLTCLADETSDNWSAAFRETQTSLKSFGLLLRVDDDYVFDTSFSSTRDGCVFKQSIDGHLESIFTRSARNRYEGPKILRRKIYRNLNNPQMHFILVSLTIWEDVHVEYDCLSPITHFFTQHDWRPLEDTVNTLRLTLGRYALFFYNEFAPEVIAVLWRPSTFQPKPFTAVNSEYVCPVEFNNWKSDSLAVENVKDFLRELTHATRDIVVDVKLFNSRSSRRRSETPAEAQKRDIAEVGSGSDSEDSSRDLRI